MDNKPQALLLKFIKICCNNYKKPIMLIKKIIWKRLKKSNNKKRVNLKKKNLLKISFNLNNFNITIFELVISIS